MYLYSHQEQSTAAKDAQSTCGKRIVTRTSSVEGYIYVQQGSRFLIGGKIVLDCLIVPF